MVRVYPTQEGLCQLACPCAILSYNLSTQSAERLPLKFSQLIETVSKKPILPHQKNVVVEVMASDENDEDVEVRFIASECSSGLISGLGPLFAGRSVIACCRTSCYHNKPNQMYKYATDTGQFPMPYMRTSRTIKNSDQ